MLKRYKSSELRVYVVPEEAKVEEIQKVAPTTDLDSAIIKNKAGIDIHKTNDHTEISYKIFTDEIGKKLPVIGYIIKKKNYIPCARTNFGDIYINNKYGNMIEAMLDGIPKYDSYFKDKCSDSVKDMLKQKLQQLGEKLNQERTKLDEEEKRQLEQEQKMGAILRDACEEVYGQKITTEKSELMAAAIKAFLDRTKGLAESSMSEQNRKNGQEEER